jgi:hypothetical protein
MFLQVSKKVADLILEKQPAYVKVRYSLLLVIVKFKTD